ncbi:MAG TPA: folylpolyglutamate synthase/dihydrofolate synthase family protein [Kiritimatiellia bacterium]|nr:folylpolyglutamate synthase/dihydrofolate synthase family protein [Kiritimatiellia bacterium]HPS06961.1 folylpolyglutamate synthase/dihydrofolate synthase family protein [Kiritimatiellia bacterium]
MLNYLQQLADRRRFGMKPGLDTIRALLERLGHPEREIAAIHIAGTNGKGAVAALCESVLRAAGYPVARYTSPHLVRVNERFLVNGEPVDDAALEAAAQEVEAAVRVVENASMCEVTFFECLTAVAFVLFRRLGIKLVALETGLGGRLDATNVVTPLVSVITRIGLDHCDWLGDTVDRIAGEKAGIIKPGCPVVCGAMPDEARRVIAAKAAQGGSQFVDAADAVAVAVSKSGLDGQTIKVSTQDRALPPVRLPLAGAFQVENVCTAVAALETVAQCGLPIPDEAFVKGLGTVCWPGRFQLAVKTPPVIVDGAHNPEGARALRQALKRCQVKKPIGLVAGFCGDKDALAHLRVLAPVVKRAWGVATRNPRSLTAEQTVGVMRMAGLDAAAACGSVRDALEAAQQWAREADGVVLVCGSLFLAGEALVALGAFPWPSDRNDANELLKSTP